MNSDERPKSRASMKRTQPQPAEPVTSLELSERDLAILDLVLWRFMWTAYHKATDLNRAELCEENVESGRKFHQDGQDAEDLLRRVREKIAVIKENKL